MIDPPTQAPESGERRAELDKTVDYAVQLLLEEARSVGWAASEFLTAVMDSADRQLAVIEDKPQLDVPSTDGAE